MKQTGVGDGRRRARSVRRSMASDARWSTEVSDRARPTGVHLARLGRVVTAPFGRSFSVGLPRILPPGPTFSHLRTGQVPDTGQRVMRNVPSWSNTTSDLVLVSQ